MMLKKHFKREIFNFKRVHIFVNISLCVCHSAKIFLTFKLSHFFVTHIYTIFQYIYLRYPFGI